MRIGGYVDPGFEGVRDAFVRNFEEHGEIGAGFCLHVEGRKVVDIWGGMADQKTGREYAEDTLQLVFSTTKGATAICANRLAQEGRLDVDAPVVEYWPEFAQAGKEHIPVRWLLCHKAGLPVTDRAVTLDEALRWDPAVEALAAQKPVWEPGTAHGYHAVTFGYLVGEVVRRVTGGSLGTYFAEQVARPLGLEFWVGLPDEQQDRCAPIVPSPPPTDPEARALIAQFIGPDTLTGRALSAPGGAFSDAGVWNLPKVRAAEVPAANGVTNARSLSRMYAAVIGEIDGVHLLSDEQVKAATERQTEGTDRVLFFETTFGLGFMLTSAFSPYGGPQGFGHAGAGGSLGFADPETGIAFGYVMNRMMQNLSGDPRTIGLVDACYEAIGSPYRASPLPES
jgi:CubicO group peptidase (beta-lactamase class C family)